MEYQSFLVVRKEIMKYKILPGFPKA